MMPELSTLPAAVTAIPIGIAFGVILERVGLGDPRVISAQLTGRDFTVLRVMFGAIVTAMLGVAWLGRAGMADLNTIAIPPTDIAGQLLGAVIFGGGFALAALCPGTACVAASTGRRDGIAAVVGILVGTAATALLWPLLSNGVNETVREAATLDNDFGISKSAVVLVITCMAVTAFALTRRFSGGSSQHWVKPRSLEIVALTLATTFALTDGSGVANADQLGAIASEIEREDDHVDAIDLAEWIREGRQDLRIIDLRDGLDSTTYMIPGAQTASLLELPMIDIDGKLTVLYSDGGAHAAQGWVLLRARGYRNIRVLKDGMAAWEDEVLQPVVPSASADDSTRQRFEHARELSLWFGGRPRLETDPVGDARAVSLPAKSRPRRRNTC